jgi:hypothetical protein
LQTVRKRKLLNRKVPACSVFSGLLVVTTVMAVALSTDKVEVNPSDLEATASHSLKQLGNLTMKSPNSQQSFHYL